MIGSRSQDATCMDFFFKQTFETGHLRTPHISSSAHAGAILVVHSALHAQEPVSTVGGVAGWEQLLASQACQTHQLSLRPRERTHATPARCT